MGEKETKLSFSLSSKPSSRPNPPKPSIRDSESGAGNSTATQFVTVFDPSQILDSAAASRLVISPIPNADYLHPSKRSKHFLPLPTADDDPSSSSVDTKFVLDTTSSAGADSNVQYGLTVRSTSNGSGSEPHPHDDEERREPGDFMLRRFREDMNNLPDDRGFDEFKDVPVEGFAAAILAGYGWSEGKGIGRHNNKGDTKVVEYDRRAGTHGLGYNPSMSDPQKQRGEWKVMEKGRVFKVVKEAPTVDVANNVGKRGKEEKKRNRDEERKKGDNLGQKPSSSRAGEVAIRWLTSHIRVRIISKDLIGGKLYLKKGEVVDVVGPTTCDISMDGSRELVQGVEQHMLETALPKRGGSVLVLYGKHKGVYGNLVERNLDDETGVVRDADSHAMINVRLEQIAEYVGDPELLGY
ncbi:protein MOS2-like [Typha latifolia]|uniref:protein MOS2-like n=1 Tax=Typha latifolia TaxID=4733 RepID=UPI003C2FD907